MLNKQLEHQEFTPSDLNITFELLLHNISSPYNIGGLFRLADAMGITKLWFSGETPFPPNKKIQKTARSTEKYVAFEKVDDPLILVKRLIEEGYQIVCLEICANSIAIEDLKLPANQKVCLVLGEENNGVHPDLLALADNICHIAMYGKNSSMNLVSATSIAAHSITRKLIE